MGFDRETAKAAKTRALQRRQDRVAIGKHAAATKRHRPPRQQLGVAGRQLLPGLLVKKVELWTGCATRSARRSQRVVRVSELLDAGAAAVVVSLDGDIVAVAFAPHIPTLLGIRWPSRRRCRVVSRRHRFGCSSHTGALDADVVNLGLATRSGRPFASGMLQQVWGRATPASRRVDPTFERREAVHSQALGAVQEHARIDGVVDEELKDWAGRHARGMAHNTPYRANVWPVIPFKATSDVGELSTLAREAHDALDVMARMTASAISPVLLDAYDVRQSTGWPGEDHAVGDAVRRVLPNATLGVSYAHGRRAKTVHNDDNGLGLTYHGTLSGSAELHLLLPGRVVVVLPASVGYFNAFQAMYFHRTVDVPTAQQLPRVYVSAYTKPFLEGGALRALS